MTLASSTTRHRVARNGTLVLGGGFAGGYVARRLGRAGATIVNPTNFMLYTPLLPEAAAGSIEPRHVVVPLRAMCPDADLLLGAAVALDPERRTVAVESEAGHFTVAYHDLVIALGAVTRMPDVPGLREHALCLKDLPDAIRLRNHVLRQIELADAAPDTAERRLTFVFAGAGFAGVEALAELQELADGALRRHRRLDRVEPRWVLVDHSPRILGQVPDRLARSAARVLQRRGVEIVTGTALESVDGAGRCSPTGRAWTPRPSSGPPASPPTRSRLGSACRSTPAAACRWTSCSASTAWRTCGRWATAPRSRTRRRPASSTPRPATRAAPGPAARPQPGRVAAVRLQDARADGHARAPARHRRARATCRSPACPAGCSRAATTCSSSPCGRGGSG